MTELFSMTGFGRARLPCAESHLTVEVKSVNHRFFKLNTRLPNASVVLEAAVEAQARAAVKRGHLSISVSLERANAASTLRLDEEVLRGYQATLSRLGLPLHAILTLPGVVENRTNAADIPLETLSSVIREACAQALAALAQMRQREGEALRGVLTGACAALRRMCGQIRPQGRVAAQAYQTRLTARLGELLREHHKAGVDPVALATQVALFAERCDITEECDRLAAHLDAAERLLRAGGEAGRSLEFLAQEMHREVNTMGSKAADLTTSNLVVEMKAELERLREQVANVA